MSQAMLQVKTASKHFLGLKAVDEVSLSVHPGEIVSIIGPNGAGKTTFFNLLTGQLAPTSGEVLFEGQPINHLPPHARARLGMGRTFQISKPLIALTALENVMIGAFLRDAPLTVARDKAMVVLEKVGLARLAMRRAGDLTLSERRRLASVGASSTANTQVLLEELANPDISDDTLHRRPDRLIVNAVLTVALLAALIAAVLPLPVLFMIGFAVAMLLNYPTIDEQKALLSRHAGNVLAVVGLIFAAGIFTGILSGTKMVDAMAESVIQLVPPVLGPYLAIVTGVLSIPFTFFISNDAFYFGVLPILAKAGQAYGISAAEMARASLIGQPVHLLSPLVPSTFLLVGLVGVDFDDHQRYTLKWALGSAAVLLLAGLVTLVIPLRG